MKLCQKRGARPAQSSPTLSDQGDATPAGTRCSELTSVYDEVSALLGGDPAPLVQPLEEPTIVLSAVPANQDRDVMLDEFPRACR